jgi:hypothetical protein
MPVSLGHNGDDADVGAARIPGSLSIATPGAAGYKRLSPKHRDCGDWHRKQIVASAAVDRRAGR